MKELKNYYGKEIKEDINIVESATGWEIWNIGKNNPIGYLGLIKNWEIGKSGETAYIKIDDLDLLERFVNNNYYFISRNELNRELKKNTTYLNKLITGERKIKGNANIAIARARKRIQGISNTLDMMDYLGI